MGEALNRIRRQLERTLRDHDLDSAKLEMLREQVQTEIEMHELLSSLGRNDLLLDFVGQLEEDFSRVALLKSNGLSEDERRNMQLPPGVSFEVGPNAKNLADLRFLVRHRSWLIEITWHDEHGLVVRPIEGHHGALGTSLSLETSELERSLPASERDVE